MGRKKKDTSRIEKKETVWLVRSRIAVFNLAGQQKRKEGEVRYN